MGYNLKRVKMVSKKDFNTRAFGSEFCIDEKGSLYIYTKEDRISRVNLDRTVEDFLLPGMQWTHNEDSLCFAPIVAMDGLFHVRYGEKGYYILKTDMDMNELYRISLEDGCSRKQFWYDNHFYFTVENKDIRPDKTVLVKMDANGIICWEYSMEAEDISDSEVMPLSEGRVLVPITKEYEIYKFHVIDREGKLISEIGNIILEEKRDSKYKTDRFEAEAIKDDEGNICIYTQYKPEFNSDGEIEKPFIIYTIVIDMEGRELYRRMLPLLIISPFLFDIGKYLYYDFHNYPNYEVIKVNITNGTQKTISTSETMIISMGSYVDEKVYICQRVGKQSSITCFDKEEKELWQFTTMERILLFEVKGNYLYFITKNKICIYRIEEE